MRGVCTHHPAPGALPPLPRPCAATAAVAPCPDSCSLAHRGRRGGVDAPAQGAHPGREGAPRVQHRKGGGPPVVHVSSVVALSRTAWRAPHHACWPPCTRPRAGGRRRGVQPQGRLLGSPSHLLSALDGTSLVRLGACRCVMSVGAATRARGVRGASPCGTGYNLTCSPCCRRLASLYLASHPRLAAPRCLRCACPTLACGKSVT